MALKQVLGKADATWIGAGNMIGAGIFAMPGQVAGKLPGAAWILAAWAAGGGLALAGAMVYGELGSRLLAAGGDYRFVHEAFGPLPAFLSGWAAFVLTFSAAAAAMCITALDHVQAAFPILAALEGWPEGAAAAGVVLVLTRANTAGARVSGRATLARRSSPPATSRASTTRRCASSRFRPPARCSPSPSGEATTDPDSGDLPPLATRVPTAT